MPSMWIFYLSLLTTAVVAHLRNQDQIPNGHQVPNPCSPGKYWLAVGHTDSEQGHTPKNQFGKDFAHIGRSHWTTELCQRDSDGDGVTNGAELGDSACKWSRGETPQGIATGHPGICEPLFSEKCANFESPCSQF